MPSASLTLLLLTADGAAQNQLHQAAQLRDVAVLPDQGHVRQVLLRHLVAQHLNPGGQEKVRRWAGEGQEEFRRRSPRRSPRRNRSGRCESRGMRVEEAVS